MRPCAAFAVVALYAAGGLACGALMGREWLSGTNSAGFARGAMLVPCLCLLSSALSLRWMSTQRNGNVGLFYRRLSWAGLYGSAAWSRVGWLGKWPESPWVHFGSDPVLLLLVSPSAALAMISAIRVARASRSYLTRWVVAALIASVLAVGTYCCVDLIDPIRDLSPWSARAIGALTLGGVSAAFLSAAFLFPLQRQRRSI